MVEYSWKYSVWCEVFFTLAKVFFVRPSSILRCGSYTPECLASRVHMSTSLVEYGSERDCFVTEFSDECMIISSGRVALELGCMVKCLCPVRAKLGGLFVAGITKFMFKLSLGKQTTRSCQVPFSSDPPFLSLAVALRSWLRAGSGQLLE